MEFWALAVMFGLFGMTYLFLELCHKVVKR
jgi:hypothetical protein